MKLDRYSVRFSHSTKERSTICCVVGDNGKVGLGFASCSRHDNFDRKVGRKVALARAVERLDKTERTKIWNAYKEVCRVGSGKFERSGTIDLNIRAGDGVSVVRGSTRTGATTNG